MTLTIKNGIYIVEAPVSDFKITMIDQFKKSTGKTNIANAGFFAGYDEGNTHFTLPVGHLVCDFAASNKFVRKYCEERGRFANGKFAFDSYGWQYQNQFKGKSLSTLTVLNGTASIDELAHPVTGAAYAIAGVPIMRNGADVKFATFVRGQGWDSSTLYATWHIFVGLKERTAKNIYIIGMKTVSGNMVASAEAFKKFSALGFRDVIKLDGGGSFYLNADGTTTATGENRRINTIIEFGPHIFKMEPEKNPYSRPTAAIRRGGGPAECVRWIQWELNRHKYVCAIDGSFGPTTDRLVRKFQKDHGLVVDGSCGPATIAELRK